jgi:hypothetical protein
MLSKNEMPAIDYHYYRFGSADSRDIDVLIDHPEATGTENDKQLIKKLVDKYPEITAWNMNIIRIDRGVVVASVPSKGSPDAVNNSLFDTYKLHEQLHSFPLNRKLPRHTLLAVVKCVKNVLFAYKGTPNDSYYRNFCRPALVRGTFAEQVELLLQLNFNSLFSQHENEHRNQVKSLLFRIGQTLALLNGIEIYTKSHLKSIFPDLAPMIDRQEGCATPIFAKYIMQLYTSAKALELQEDQLDHVHHGVHIVNFRLEMIIA